MTEPGPRTLTHSQRKHIQVWGEGMPRHEEIDHELPDARVDPDRLAIGYVRVSTTEQARYGVSLDAQADQVKAYCKTRDLVLLRTYIERGASGKRRMRDRPAGMRLHTQLTHPDCRGMHVIIPKLDRGFRNAVDALSSLQDLEKRDQRLHFVDMGLGPIDSSSAMGKLFFTILAAVAEAESARIGERVRDCQGRLRREGRPWGPAPYGYVKTGGTGANRDWRLEPEATEMAALGLIRWLSDMGRSFGEISRALEGEGFRPKRARKWSRQVVKQQVRRMTDDEALAFTVSRYLKGWLVSCGRFNDVARLEAYYPYLKD